MEWGTPVQWDWFLLFSRSGGHKTKETYPTKPGKPGVRDGNPERSILVQV